MTGRWWTSRELAELAAMAGAGVSLGTAAARLGRTYNATRNQSFRRGVRFEGYPLRGVETEAAVMRLLPGRSVPAVAAELGITSSGVRAAAHRLMRRGLLAKDGYRGPYRVTAKWGRVKGKAA